LIVPNITFPHAPATTNVTCVITPHLASHAPDAWAWGALHRHALIAQRSPSHSARLAHGGLRETLSDHTGLPARRRLSANAYATSLYAFTSTRAASMTCLWCGPDHRVLSAGLVDDIHVNYGLGDFERAPSAEEMIKVSNIMSVLCMSHHRCTSRRRRRRHGQTRP